MSGFNDANIAQLLQSETIHASMLIHFDFASQPLWLWEGAYQLTTLNGQVWDGMVQNNGNLVVGVSGLERIAADVSNAVTFSMSGVSSEVLALANNASADVTGRFVKVYMQFFNESGVVGNPILISSLVMDVIKTEMTGPQTRKIELTAENIFASKRRRPVNSQYTHRDQVNRFAGDLGFSLVSTMVTKTVKWPNF